MTYPTPQVNEHGVVIGNYYERTQKIHKDLEFCIRAVQIDNLRYCVDTVRGKNFGTSGPLSTDYPAFTTLKEVLVPQLRALYKQLSTLDEKFIPKLKKVFGSFAWITESDDTIILAKLFTFVPDVYDEPTKKKKPKGVVEQSTPEIKLPAEGSLIKCVDTSVFPYLELDKEYEVVAARTVQIAKTLYPMVKIKLGTMRTTNHRAELFTY